MKDGRRTLRVYWPELPPEEFILRKSENDPTSNLPGVLDRFIDPAAGDTVPVRPVQRFGEKIQHLREERPCLQRVARNRACLEEVMLGCRQVGFRGPEGV